MVSCIDMVRWKRLALSAIPQQSLLESSYLDNTPPVAIESIYLLILSGWVCCCLKKTELQLPFFLLKRVFHYLVVPKYSSFRPWNIRRHDLHSYLHLHVCTSTAKEDTLSIFLSAVYCSARSCRSKIVGSADVVILLVPIAAICRLQSCHTFMETNCHFPSHLSKPCQYVCKWRGYGPILESVKWLWCVVNV